MAKSDRQLYKNRQAAWKFMDTIFRFLAYGVLGLYGVMAVLIFLMMVFAMLGWGDL